MSGSNETKPPASPAATMHQPSPLARRLLLNAMEELAVADKDESLTRYVKKVRKAMEE